MIYDNIYFKILYILRDNSISIYNFLKKKKIYVRIKLNLLRINLLRFVIDFNKISVTNEQREFLIAKALESPQGREALAQAMANPIRTSLDYQGIGRKLLVVDPLPQGA